MKLKKTLVFLLVLSMVLSAFAFACGKKTDEEPAETGTETEAPADDENAEEPADHAGPEPDDSVPEGGFQERSVSQAGGVSQSRLRRGCGQSRPWNGLL